MAYIPAWLRLPDAIECVMAATGQSREEAQTDICQAIADQTVQIRGKLRKHTTSVRTWHKVLEGKDFVIPPEIKPADLDWEHSRPLNPWAVHYEVFRVPGYWELEWIELLRTDVESAFCAQPGGAAHRIPGKTVEKSRSRPALERAQRAFHEAFPDGDPGPVALPKPVLCRRVGEKLKELGLPDASDDTILRAAGRRRK
jgi:hypothetical protein